MNEQNVLEARKKLCEMLRKETEISVNKEIARKLMFEAGVKSVRYEYNGTKSKFYWVCDMLDGSTMFVE